MRTLKDVNEEQHARVERMAVFDPAASAWQCRKCESTIQQTTGYASVHDGPGHLSGSGRVLHYPYPYCPKCDGDPGTPRDTVDTD